MLARSFCFYSRSNNVVFRPVSKFVNCNYKLVHASRVPSAGETNRKHQTISSSNDDFKDRPKSGRTKVQSIIELMRWHKPTGTILALMPSLWSVGMFTPETCAYPDLKTMAIFTTGAIVARGMGCTMNDLLDRKYDRLVERTKMRPIACGDISAKEGLVYLAIQSTVGLYVLCLNNYTVIGLGLFSGVMISIYPLFKRFTYWPQIMLALTMNWGVLMGCAAINGTISLSHLFPMLTIYAGANFWTLYYDTIYAHQDKTDDMFIGVKSSALKLGLDTKRFLNSMTRLMFLSLVFAGILTEQQWPYFLALTASSSIQLLQVKKLDLNDNGSCWTAFDQQKFIATIIFLGVMASVALKNYEHRKRLVSEIDENSSDSVD